MQINPRSSTAARLATAVRGERIHQGLTQVELALAAGVSVRVIHQIEAKKPTTQLDSLERVLQALGLSLTVHARSEQVHAPDVERQRVRRH